MSGWSCGRGSGRRSTRCSRGLPSAASRRSCSSLDSLEDPQNFGTLLRSAEAAGVHGVIFPTHHQAPAVAGRREGLGRRDGAPAPCPGRRPGVEPGRPARPWPAHRRIRGGGATDRATGRPARAPRARRRKRGTGSGSRDPAAVRPAPADPDAGRDRIVERVRRGLDPALRGTRATRAARRPLRGRGHGDGRRRRGRGDRSPTGRGAGRGGPGCRPAARSSVPLPRGRSRRRRARRSSKATEPTVSKLEPDLPPSVEGAPAAKPRRGTTARAPATVANSAPTEAPVKKAPAARKAPAVTKRAAPTATKAPAAPARKASAARQPASAATKPAAAPARKPTKPASEPAAAAAPLPVDDTTPDDDLLPGAPRARRRTKS